MTIPSPSQLLDVWEQGVHQPPLRRAWLLLEAANAGVAGEVGRLSVGAADRQLLQLRRSLFGEQFEAVCACPGCGETMELSFTAAQLLVPENAPSVGEERHLSAAGWEIRFRAPSLADLAEAGQQPDADSARTCLLDRCVVRAEQAGAVLAPAQLPESALVALGAAVQAADPQAITELSLTCPACQHAWTSLFDVGGFLWTELHAWAQRLLREVHALAMHYGWSEADILALSPRRRRHYLELLAG